MKISILTFAQGDNYGAVWQSYSLAEVLRKLGYDVEFIFYTWTQWRFSLIRYIYPLAYSFKGFRRKYLRDFSTPCMNSNDLKDAIKKTDLCIVGSDQVWNPLITTNRAKHYFFDFLPDSMPRISYAASFGVNEWKWPEMTADIRGLLNKFKAISVREKSGVEIMERNFGIKATQVLDPTLLLGDFKKFIKPYKKERRYVLGFKFTPTEEYYNLIKRISSEMGARPKLLDILTRHFSKEAVSLNPVFFPSPVKWLNAISHASFVITDSFHCLAFSIIFNRDFVVFPTSEMNRELKGRMQSLLEELGLNDRIIYSAQEIIEKRIWENKIDYGAVNKRLKDLRKESMSFLIESLKI